MSNTTDLPELGCDALVSVRFGALSLCGCEKHPGLTNLSCCRIRRSDGTPLTWKEAWEVMLELATAKHANDLDQQPKERP